MTTRATWWGHSTVWIEDSGMCLVTDPLLADRLVHLRRAAGAAPALARPPDVVLVSHLHPDHLHLESLRRLGGEPVIVVPTGAGAFVERGVARPGSCVELTAGESTTVGPLRIRAVPAHHGDGRGPWSRLRATPIGFVVEGAVRTWYAGDTDLYEEMSGFGLIDLALIPVGGWGPSLRGGHLNPATAAEAVRLARAGLAVPVHYGTFWPVGFGRVRASLFHSPGTEFARAAARTAPGTRVHVLEHGESLSVEQPA